MLILSVLKMPELLSLKTGSYRRGSQWPVATNNDEVIRSWPCCSTCGGSCDDEHGSL
jgi:hypothetical protein